MSLKKMLGLDSFPIRDTEIMQQIEEALRRRQDVVEFVAGKKIVRLRLSLTALEGIMRDYQDYYRAE